MSPITGYMSGCLGSVNPVDALTAAWKTAVIGAGGTVSDARLTVVNSLIIGLRSDGLIAKLDRLWLLAAENSFSALIDLIAHSAAVAVNAPAFTVDRGYTGVDSSSTIYIETNFTPSTDGVTYTTNAAHYSAWNVTNLTAGGGCLMGALTAGQETTLYDTFSDNNVYGRITDAPASGGQGIPGTRIGHWIVNRSSSTLSQIYQNGSLFSSPNKSVGSAQNDSFFILGANNAGAGSSNGTPNQVAMASMGGSLSSTDTTNFYNRLRTYMTAVGVP
jgi:hypothetical protein